jgi:hypothetical protein
MEKPQTEEEKEKQRIRELEADIEEMVELLATRQSKKEHKRHLIKKKIATFSNVADAQASEVFLKHKTHKNVVVTQHVSDKMELAKTYKKHLKYEKYGEDLIQELDNATKELCVLLEKQCKRMHVDMDK